MATKSKKSTRTSTAKRKKSSAKKSSAIRTEVYFLVALGFLVLLCLSNFGLIGAVGRGIKWLGFGLLGIPAYAFPFVLAFNLLYRASNDKMNGSAKVKFTAVYFLMIFTAAFIQRVSPSPVVRESNVGDFFLHSATYKTGGGFLGGLLVKILSPTALVGSLIIIIGLMLICIVIISEWSIRGSFSAAKNKSKKIAGSIKENHKEYNEHANKTIERRKKAKEEKIKDRELTPAPEEDFVTDSYIDSFGNEYEDEDEKEFYRRRDERRKRIAERAANDKKQAEEMRRMEEELANLSVLEKKYSSASNKISPPTDTDEIISTEDPLFSEFGSLYDEDSSRTNSGFKDRKQKKDTGIVEQMKNIGAKLSYHEEELKEEPKDVEEAIHETAHEAANLPITSNIKPASRKNSTAMHPASNAHIAVTQPPASPLKESLSDGFDSNLNEYKFPPISLLKQPGGKKSGTAIENKKTAMLLQQTLNNFGVDAKIVDISCGPAVTRFEVQPGPKVKVSKIVNLSDEIKLNLAVPDIRIEAPIPGKAAVGIEVPNTNAGSVSLRELIDSTEFKAQKSRIAFAVGEDIAGQPVMADIAKMPHILIAGSTGSGKSVCINALIMSILYRARPDEVKMIMIDPKVVELSAYNGIPHLLIPVVTDPKKASGALNWAVAEMDSRYNKFAEVKARNLADYNEKVKSGSDPELAPMPQMLVIIDELADLMMVSPGEVETSICRLAQLARAAGIHLIIATQRPSVNVITGLIKANVPSRIAFAVSSGVDSRTIIDMNGAEKLLGKGDMLFFPTGVPKPQRVQGAFVSDSEVADVVNFLKENNSTAEPENEDEDFEKITSTPADFPRGSASDTEDERDELFAEAGRFVIEKDRGSIGLLQRNFRIGFNRAGRIMDQLTEAGVVGAETGTKPRQVLMSAEEFETYLASSKNLS